MHNIYFVELMIWPKLSHALENSSMLLCISCTDPLLRAQTSAKMKSQVISCTTFYYEVFSSEVECLNQCGS